jgi:membrane protein YdbS with pleckstrin-like domain
METPSDTTSSFSDLHELAPATLRVWRLKMGAWLSILVVAALVYDIMQFFDVEKGLPFAVMPGVLLLAGLGLVFWITALRFRCWRYALRDTELVLVRGVFNRVHTIVPLRRIQHLDVSQDIFEREYDLGKLIIHTAGTRSSDVVLPGLEIEEAERLRDEMKKVITDEAI